MKNIKLKIFIAFFTYVIFVVCGVAVAGDMRSGSGCKKDADLFDGKTMSSGTSFEGVSAHKCETDSSKYYIDVCRKYVDANGTVTDYYKDRTPCFATTVAVRGIILKSNAKDCCVSGTTCTSETNGKSFAGSACIPTSVDPGYITVLSKIYKRKDITNGVGYYMYE